MACAVSWCLYQWSWLLATLLAQTDSVQGAGLGMINGQLVLCSLPQLQTANADIAAFFYEIKVKRANKTAETATKTATSVFLQRARLQCRKNKDLLYKDSQVFLFLLYFLPLWPDICSTYLVFLTVHGKNEFVSLITCVRCLGLIKPFRGILRALQAVALQVEHLFGQQLALIHFISRNAKQ